MATLWQQLRTRLREVDGLVQSASMFGGDAAWWVNGKEIAHPHGDGVIEVRLTKPVISELRGLLGADERVELRRSGADWVTVRYASGADVAFVAALVDAAAAAHRPPPGVTAEPPPTGADLERRRRFH